MYFRCNYFCFLICTKLYLFYVKVSSMRYWRVHTENSSKVRDSKATRGGQSRISLTLS